VTVAAIPQRKQESVRPIRYDRDVKLVEFEIEGFGRFEERTSLKVVGNLVAILGPNEAGKSTLLRAMASLKDSEFLESDKPRRSNLSPLLRWHFKLSEENKAAIEDFAEGVERVVVQRSGSGERKTWFFLPNRPTRPMDHRRPLVEMLRALELLDHPLFEQSTLPDAIDTLERDVETLESDWIDGLEQLSETIRSVSASEAAEASASEDEVERDSADDSRNSTIALLDATADALDDAVLAERDPTPVRKVIDELSDQLPDIVLYAHADRDLRSEYDLDLVASAPPAALSHLTALAGLDLQTLAAAIEGGRMADVSTWRSQANDQLRDAFADAWTQQQAPLQFEVQGTTLLIQVSGDDGFSSVAEHSDGMRWFAALMAFAHGWKNPTILLADEIETHLHYDAQTDLVEILINQPFAEKVVYTTHSFGCLPPDLGAGVRIVRQLDDRRSRIENGFWGKGSGFSPLLAGMGAASLGLMPTRLGIITEGPSDAVLLPALLREASGEESLPYSIAPGLSTVSAVAMADLAHDAATVAFLTDSDPGGEELRRLLREAGIPDSLVFELEPGGECTLEDLIDTDIYVDVANRHLDGLGAEKNVDSNLFANRRRRARFLHDWCAGSQIPTPRKVDIAQELADISVDRQILTAGAVALLQALHEHFCAITRA